MSTTQAELVLFSTCAPLGPHHGGVQFSRGGKNAWRGRKRGLPSGARLRSGLPRDQSHRSRGIGLVPHLFPRGHRTVPTTSSPGRTQHTRSASRGLPCDVEKPKDAGGGLSFQHACLQTTSGHPPPSKRKEGVSGGVRFTASASFPVEWMVHFERRHVDELREDRRGDVSRESSVFLYSACQGPSCPRRRDQMSVTGTELGRKL